MDKEYLKSVVYSCEMRITAIITEGVINRASRRDIMRSVDAEVSRLKFLNRVERNDLLDFTKQFYRHTVAAAGRKTDLQKRSEQVYTVLRKDTPKMESIKNSIVDNIEYRKKHKELTLMLMDDDQKFYYCTVLKDAASDHAPYQGLIYYRKNRPYSEEEKEFISSQKLLSLDEVVLRPPWLTTRRNCRHKFVPISFKEAQNGYSESERSFHEISYEEEQYRLYRDRYKMLANIKKTFQKTDTMPEQLKVDMRRTRNLVISWNRARKEAEKKADRN